MIDISIDIEGIALKRDVRDQRWVAQIDRMTYALREWSWGERRELVRMATLDGRLDKSVFTRGLFELLVDPEPLEHHRLQLACCMLYVLGVPRSREAVSLARAQYLLAGRLGWRPDEIKNQSCRDIDSTVREIIGPSSQPAGSEPDGEGWQTIVVREDEPVPTAAEPQEPGADGSIDLELRLSRWLETVAVWARLSGDEAGASNAGPPEPETMGHAVDGSASQEPPSDPRASRKKPAAAAAAEIVGPATAGLPAAVSNAAAGDYFRYQGRVRLKAPVNETASRRDTARLQSAAQPAEQFKALLPGPGQVEPTSRAAPETTGALNPGQSRSPESSRSTEIRPPDSPRPAAANADSMPPFRMPPGRETSRPGPTGPMTTADLNGKTPAGHPGYLPSSAPPVLMKQWPRPPRGSLPPLNGGHAAWSADHRTPSAVPRVDVEVDWQGPEPMQPETSGAFVRTTDQPGRSHRPLQDSAWQISSTNPFDLSELEETMADVLERAAREAGMDL